ncbi:MAG: BatA and WFA domain-containing protein [Lentisphaeria bacterium]|nr:BatA and WFA domain-containing protein [Lentisphaeria bacterium]
MNFLNLPSLLYLLPLAAIPLIIHLLNKKFPKVLMFSNISFIKKSLSERSKLFRLRHIIMVILRTIAILLLILCFLMPMWNKFGAEDKEEEAGRFVYIILDHSISMYAEHQGNRPASNATIEIEKIIHSLSNDDAVNLYLAGDTVTRCFPRASKQHAELLAFLKNRPDGKGTAHIETAKNLAARDINKVAKPAEIFIVSDFQRENWTMVNLENIPKQTRVFYVDTALKDRSNRAILDIELTQSVVLANSSLSGSVRIANYSNQTYKDNLEVLINNEQSQIYKFEIPPQSVGLIPIEEWVGGAGLHQIKLSITPDGMPQDNQYFLTVDARDKEEILLLTDLDYQIDHANYILGAAINPFKDQSGSLVTKVLPSNSLSEVQLTGIQKVIISGIYPLTDETAELLMRFMEVNGGRVVYFMEGIDDIKSIQKLHALSDQTMPFLPDRLLNAKNLSNGRIQLLKGDFNSGFLQTFAKEHRQSLGKIDFYRYFQSRPTGNGEVLLNFSDGTPAMGVNYVGGGQFLLCNFSAAENASNLASRNFFPIWIQQIIEQLDPREIRQDFYSLGEPMAIEIWRSDMKQNQFLDPNMEPINVDTQGINDERMLIRFSPAEVGHYQLYKGQRLKVSLPVNVTRKESNLLKLDKSKLPTSTEVTGYVVTGAQAYDDIKEGKNIFHYFLIGCLIFLIIEMFLFQYFKRLSRI